MYDSTTTTVAVDFSNRDTAISTRHDTTRGDVMSGCHRLLYIRDTPFRGIVLRSEDNKCVPVVVCHYIEHLKHPANDKPSYLIFYPPIFLFLTFPPFPSALKPTTFNAGEAKPSKASPASSPLLYSLKNIP